MVDLRKITAFEWDKANIHKNYDKHHITPNEAELVFFDKDRITFPDKKHSENESRYIMIGKTRINNWLYVVFTLRKNKIRIISARRMHTKERTKYHV